MSMMWSWIKTLIVIFSLLPVSSSEITCPELCECSGGSHHLTMKCSNLISIPSITPDSFSQIIKVVFSHNPLKLVDDGTFRLMTIGYKDIHELEMKACMLEEVPYLMFEDLKSLRSLDLRYVKWP